MKPHCNSSHRGKKPTILALLPVYLPVSATGPVQTVSSLAEHLGGTFNFRIITSEKCNKRSNKNFKNKEWNEVGSSKVLYASPYNIYQNNLLNVINETKYDILYLNTFYHPVFGFAPLLMNKLNLVKDRPIVIAPRGQMDKNSISIKYWKKIPFIHIHKLLKLHRNIIWQASSEEEKANIKRTMGKKVNVIVAKNPPSATGPAPRSKWRKKKSGQLEMLFLSRISPKKNLKYALDIISKIRASLEINIIGPVDDEAYWRKCRERMKSLHPNLDVHYRGVVNHENVVETMASYDLFFLPTLGENYGHVIQEALSAGTPVLVSDQTPWRNLQEKGIGWDLPLDRPDRFREAIRKCIQKGPGEYRRWRENVVEWERKRRRRDPVVQQNRKLFRKALAMGKGGTRGQTESSSMNS